MSQSQFGILGVIFMLISIIGVALSIDLHKEAFWADEYKRARVIRWAAIILLVIGAVMLYIAFAWEYMV